MAKKKKGVVAFGIIYTLGIIFVIVALIIVYNNANNSILIWTKANSNEANQFGGFIGGILGPILTFASTFFLIATLYYQSVSSATNQAESTFYKLIEFHKLNVENVSIYTKNNHIQITGYGALKLLEERFNNIFSIVKEKNNYGFDEKTLIDISYNFFLFGISEESAELIKEKIRVHFKDETMVNSFYTEMDKVSSKSISSKVGDEVRVFEACDYFIGHYFRNLYNAVKLVDNCEYFNEVEKYEYIKVLRTQLSTPEIWILFINSLTKYGNEWKEQGLIERYEIIKNLPNYYSKSKINPRDYYAELLYEDMK